MESNFLGSLPSLAVAVVPLQTRAKLQSFLLIYRSFRFPTAEDLLIKFPHEFLCYCILIVADGGNKPGGKGNL